MNCVAFIGGVAASDGWATLFDFTDRCCQDGHLIRYTTTSTAVTTIINTDTNRHWCRLSQHTHLYYPQTQNPKAFVRPIPDAPFFFTSSPITVKAAVGANIFPCVYLGETSSTRPQSSWALGQCLTFCDEFHTLCSNKCNACPRLLSCNDRLLDKL